MQGDGAHDSRILVRHAAKLDFGEAKKIDFLYDQLFLHFF